MSRDKEGGAAKRPRLLNRASAGWPPPLQELKDLLYRAYAAAGAPSLDEIAKDIAEDDNLAGAPSRDTIRRCISEPRPVPNQADAVSVAVVLARRAVWDERALAVRVRELCLAAGMAMPAGRQIAAFNDHLVLDDLEVHPALALVGLGQVGWGGACPSGRVWR